MPPTSHVVPADRIEDPHTHIAPDLATAILASSKDAIIGQDLQGRITSWNRGAEDILGFTASEMIGTSILRLSRSDLLHEEPRLLDIIRRGERIESIDTVRQTKDGRLIDVSITASPITNAGGQIIGVLKIGRDITQLKQRERELAGLSRLYAALSRISSTIIYAPSRHDLFPKVCRALVDQGGFRAVWIGWHDPATHRLVPVASQGDTENYLGAIAVYTDNRPEGQGPAGIAFREGRNYICNDISRDPATLPWRTQMEAHGWRASAVFPIRSAGKTCACLTVYAEEPVSFQDNEISLLTEAANVISFALDNFDRDDGRRQAEQTVRDERDFTTALIDSLPGMLCLFDKDARFVRWNKNFARLSGYRDDEIGSLHPIDVFLPADRDLILDSMREGLETGMTNLEARFLSKDGQVTPYYLTGSRIEIAGQKYLVGVGLDATERKNAEAARQIAEDAAREAQSELARVARVSLLGEFAASVAHEVNQPLAAIVTNSGASLRWLARTPPNLDEARDAIDRIARDANRASDVIDRLRRLVTRQPAEHVDIDMNALLNEVLIFLNGELRTSNIAVRTELADDLPPVRGDRIQLQQVMLNLVTNGVDAMKPVTDRSRVLALKTGIAGSGGVMVEVADSGNGFDPAATDRLFDHFYSTKTGGTGLGLSISRTIIENHGGRIIVVPASPHGAIFRFTIPKATEPAS